MRKNTKETDQKSTEEKRMKMGVGTRIIFSILMLLIIAVCIGIILGAFGVIPAANVQALLDGYLHSGFRYIWVAAALILICLCIALLFFGRKKTGPSSVILTAGADGSVYIALAALEELTQRYLNEVYGILVQSISAKPLTDRNVRVNISLSAKPEVVIQDVTQNITTGIKEYIEKYSGITVVDVKIKVLPLNQFTYGK